MPVVPFDPDSTPSGARIQRGCCASAGRERQRRRAGRTCAALNCADLNIAVPAGPVFWGRFPAPDWFQRDHANGAPRISERQHGSRAPRTHGTADRNASGSRGPSREGHEGWRHNLLALSATRSLARGSARHARAARGHRAPAEGRTGNDTNFQPLCLECSDANTSTRSGVRRPAMTDGDLERRL